MSKAKHPHAWSLTGAARAAREARIESVKSFSTPAMAEWQESAVQGWLEGYQEHDWGDSCPATVRLLGDLGYLPPYPDREHLPKVILHDEARYLRHADLYVLSPQMADVVVAAALTLTLEDFQLLRAEDMPTPTGLLVLPHPLLVRESNGELTDLRAFLWWSPARMVVNTGVMHAKHARTIPAVHMSLYKDGHGPVQPKVWRDFVARAAAAGTPVPPLCLGRKRCLALGQEFAAGAYERLSLHARMFRQRWYAHNDRLVELGLEDDLVIGEYMPGQEIDDLINTIEAKILFTFWRLAKQRIAVADHAPVPHSARVAAERAGVPADVRVVLLRRTDERHGSGQSSGAVNWQHRWPVRMHKVRQWYPSRGVHDILWRGPYVKGPADKPLIGGETVWGLVR